MKKFYKSFEEFILQNSSKNSEILKLQKYFYESEKYVHHWYHNSDNIFKEFKKRPPNGDSLVRDYLFFSSEPNMFIYREYMYEVKLNFRPNRIFNPFKHVDEFGLKYNIDEEEVKKLLGDNLDYFYAAWIKSNVDSPEEVLEYGPFISEGGDETDKLGLLFHFVTEWNDSWAILETNLFLDYIKRKGFDGFVTIEEGIINLALRENFDIQIIDRRQRK